MIKCRVAVLPQSDSFHCFANRAVKSTPEDVSMKNEECFRDARATRRSWRNSRSIGNTQDAVSRDSNCACLLTDVVLRVESSCSVVEIERGPGT